MTDKRKSQKTQKNLGKTSKAEKKRIAGNTTDKGEDQDESDYGGMNASNFRKNLGCGG
jgi:hypothetical protein